MSGFDVVAFRRALVEDRRKLLLRITPDAMGGHPVVGDTLTAADVLESVIHAIDRGLGEPHRPPVTHGDTEIHRDCGGTLVFHEGYYDAHWECDKCSKRNPSINNTALVEGGK